MLYVCIILALILLCIIMNSTEHFDTVESESITNIFNKNQYTMTKNPYYGCTCNSYPFYFSPYRY